MYVVLVNGDNTLSAPKKERIIQRSKRFNDFWFLVHPQHNGYDMSNCTVLLEYLKPVSKQYKTEILVLSEDRYKEYLKYTLPVDTEFTAEAGTLELQLSFIYVDIDINGKAIQRVRKTAPSLKIEIVPISAWSDVIPDSALTSIDQRIIKQDAQIKALAEIATTINDNKADNLAYNSNSNELQLMSGNKLIGDKVVLQCRTDDEVPVVDFSDLNNDNNFDDEDDILVDVVEF